MGKSIYDQMGGFTSVRKIVVSFYDRVLDDEKLAPIFAKSEMQTVIDHQTKFIAMLLGGPASYSDEEIKKIHDKLTISNEDFDGTKEHLIETLEDFDFSSEHINFIANEFEIRREFVVRA